MDSRHDEQESITKEVLILSEIREAEKEAERILERAGKEKDAIIQEARANASKLLLAKEEEIRRNYEKRLMDFRDKARIISEEKLSEGRASARQAKIKSEKNIQKAADFVLKRFEEIVQNA